MTVPGLAAALWQGCAEDVAVSDLVAVATDLLGPHPDAVRLVLDSVAVLVERGLVVIR
jgi:hypothetical protein